MLRINAFLSAFMLVVFVFVATAVAQDSEDRLKTLEEQVVNQQQTIDQQQKTLDSLKEEIANPNGWETQPTIQDIPTRKATGLFGGSAFTNPNISLVLDGFAYASDLDNHEREERGIPDFTTQGLEQRNGFNIDSAELFIFSPVDPYFNLYTNIPVTEDGVELEEAYFVTTALPAGWQIKGGRFKSNFSRLDAQHPHAWDFYDIALPYRAFLGDEGLGGENGVQVTYLPVLPIYTQFGAEVFQGENPLLFGPDAQQSPHAYTFFIKSSFDTDDFSTLYFGPSIVFGKTQSADILPDMEVNGNVALYGMEAVWKWKPAYREALTVQSEYLFLTQSGSTQDKDTPDVMDSLRRKQDGFYIQCIFRKDRWGIGARYDVLNLFSDKFELAGVQQNIGSRPHRETVSIEYNPSEFTRFRLQFNRDQSDPCGRINNEAVLQFNMNIGAHPAHSF